MPSMEQVVCMHFCKFRKAGSSLKYTHVHLYDAPDGVNGVGHDDERKPSHPHHTTISRRNKCDFHKNRPGTNGTTKAYFHPTGAKGREAYFHECDNQECPPGYKRIKCKCGDEEKVTEEIWVCYTLDHDTFWRWYYPQRWDNRKGSYEYPSTNISGTVPTSIPCDSSIILRNFKSYRINPPADCTGYGGPQDGMNPKDCGYGYFDFEEFSKAVDSARSQFVDRLCILKGVEFENVLKKDLDVVLGAVHWLGEFLISDKELQERFKKEEILEKYYTEVLKTTKFGGFDILAHLDSPKRYLKQPCNEWNLIDEILGELAKSGIALEINTLPLRKGLNECSPDQDLLERYVEHKGRRVCIGSDAHSSPDIGAGFEYAQGLVRRNNKLDIGIFLEHEFLSINLANIPGVD